MYFRAIVTPAMMIVLSLVTISGFLLWSVSHGPRSVYQKCLTSVHRLGEPANGPPANSKPVREVA